jgi:GNAT superfamily N-acetyltransferase
MKIDLRKATAGDIGLLIDLRLDYLREDSGELKKQDEKAIRSQLSGYFKHNIDLGFTAIIAEADGKVASCAFLVVSEKPANLHFINGISGTVLNVITYSQYRRQGVASKVLSALIEEAKVLGVSQLELFATPQGRPLYEKLGFNSPQYTAMRLKL